MTRVSSIQRVLRPRQIRRTHKVPEQIQGSKTINATRAKNAFGEIMKSVRKSVPVFIEKHGKALHLDVKVSYQRFLGAGPVQEAIGSGEIDIGPFGTAPLLAAWEKGRDSPQQILAVSGLTTLPLAPRGICAVLNREKLDGGTL